MKLGSTVVVNALGCKARLEGFKFNATGVQVIVRPLRAFRRKKAILPLSAVTLVVSS